MPKSHKASTDNALSNHQTPQKPAPGLDAGAEVELRAEELEERIAPRLASNHNVTVLIG
ncbi:MAG TPA: hypothetical protein VEB59_17505 [Gemmatimonadales bacterium]|nr:hypothetical protein [Gemmatimonadales bacterium]